MNNENIHSYDFYLREMNDRYSLEKRKIELHFDNEIHQIKFHDRAKLLEIESLEALKGEALYELEEKFKKEKIDLMEKF